MNADNQQAIFPILESESSETTRRIPPKQALAILLGLLYTDGCVSPKGKSWRIYFVNKSKKLIELFRDSVATVFEQYHPNIRIGFTKDCLYTAIVDSKIIGNFLVGSFGTFRTLKFENGELPPAQLPLEFLQSSEISTKFLQAAFSCDGGICFYPAKRYGKNGGTQWLIRTVFLACAHPKLRAGYRSLLENLGIYSREVPKDGKIKIEREEDVRKFAEIIKFVPGTFVTLHSKYWNGIEKNEVLSKLVSSYGNPSKFYNLKLFKR